MVICSAFSWDLFSNICSALVETVSWSIAAMSNNLSLDDVEQREVVDAADMLLGDEIDPRLFVDEIDLAEYEASVAEERNNEHDYPRPSTVSPVGNVSARDYTIPGPSSAASVYLPRDTGREQPRRRLLRATQQFVLPSRPPQPQHIVRTTNRVSIMQPLYQRRMQRNRTDHRQQQLTLDGHLVGGSNGVPDGAGRRNDGHREATSNGILAARHFLGTRFSDALNSRGTMLRPLRLPRVPLEPHRAVNMDTDEGISVDENSGDRFNPFYFGNVSGHVSVNVSGNLSANVSGNVSGHVTRNVSNNGRMSPPGGEWIETRPENFDGILDGEHEMCKIYSRTLDGPIIVQRIVPQPLSQFRRTETRFNRLVSDRDYTKPTTCSADYQDDLSLLNSPNYAPDTHAILEVEKMVVEECRDLDQQTDERQETLTTEEICKVEQSFRRLVTEMAAQEEEIRRRRIFVNELAGMYGYVARLSPELRSQRRLVAILRLAMRECERFHGNLSAEDNSPLRRLAESVLVCDVCMERKRALSFTFNESCPHMQCRVCLREDYRTKFEIVAHRRDAFLPHKPCNICRTDNRMYIGLRRSADTFRFETIRVFSQI